MQLSQYPSAIATAANAVIEIEQRITEYQDALNAIELETELVVQFDADLKNAEQRKARKAEILAAHDEHPIKVRLIARARHDRAIAAIVLEQRRNEWSAIKLEARLKIAEAVEF
jgi:hypothetical protein